MFSISRVSLLLCLLIITVGCQKGADPSSEKQSSAPTNESAKTDSKETTSSKTETASKSADKEDPKSEGEQRGPEPGSLRNPPNREEEDRWTWTPTWSATLPHAPGVRRVSGRHWPGTHSSPLPERDRRKEMRTAEGGNSRRRQALPPAPPWTLRNPEPVEPKPGPPRFQHSTPGPGAFRQEEEMQRPE